jgi:hypothetical protein
MRSITPNGVSGFDTASARPMLGMRRSAAETIVQLRPPKRGTMNVYGMRRVAPTRLGMEMSQKISPVVNSKPAAGRETTTTDQSCQTTNPRNSAKIDQRRLREATPLPSASHWAVSSGSHPSIQRPGRRVMPEPLAAGAVCGAVVVGAVMVGGAAVMVSSGGRRARSSEEHVR